MSGSKPCSTPMDSALQLHQDNGPIFSNVLLYRHLVGHLLYLVTTSLDIAFATQQLSQFMANPTQAHFWAVMHVLRYLKGCPNIGLFFSRDSPIQVRAFSDAD